MYTLDRRLAHCIPFPFSGQQALWSDRCNRLNPLLLVGIIGDFPPLFVQVNVSKLFHLFQSLMLHLVILRVVDLTCNCRLGWLKG